MNEEDEAFEDLAKRQGDWGMQGSRKHQIMRYAENVENKGTSMTDKEAMKLALEALQTLMIERGSIYDKAITALKARLAQEKALEALHNENERLGLYKDAYAEQEPVYHLRQYGDVTKEQLDRYIETGDINPPAHPPQRTEQNFCSRCGKRTKDIHTCTPPKD
jgi:hypothetical protein